MPTSRAKKIRRTWAVSPACDLETILMTLSVFTQPRKIQGFVGQAIETATTCPTKHKPMSGIRV